MAHVACAVRDVGSEPYCLHSLKFSIHEALARWTTRFCSYSLFKNGLNKVRAQQELHIHFYLRLILTYQVRKPFWYGSSFLVNSNSNKVLLLCYNSTYKVLLVSNSSKLG